MTVHRLVLDLMVREVIASAEPDYQTRSRRLAARKLAFRRTWDRSLPHSERAGRKPLWVRGPDGGRVLLPIRGRP